ncbi:ABC transporter transmembrane domain-containing protein [Streptomyces sp. NPDC058286]|uniref:ABC transporter transmembrane domain-containing protein n=1 Tax=Streptomyces sp. NPDC058286 TaxID=3346422 RepID=UPI0036F0E77E
MSRQTIVGVCLMVALDTTSLVLQIFVSMQVGRLVDLLLAGKSSKEIVWKIALMLAFATLEAVALWARWIPATVGPRAVAAQHKKISDSLALNAPNSSRKTTLGELSRLVAVDSLLLERHVTLVIVFGISNTLTVVAFGIAILQIDAALGIIALAGLFPIILLSLAFNRRLADMLTRLEEKRARAAQDTLQLASHRRDFAACGILGALEVRNQEYYEAVAHQFQKARGVRALMVGALSGYPLLIVAFVAYRGSLDAQHGNLSVGSLATVLALLLRVIYPFKAFGSILPDFQEGLAASRRLQRASAVSFLQPPNFPVEIIPTGGLRTISANNCRVLRDGEGLVIAGGRDDLLETVAVQLAKSLSSLTGDHPLNSLEIAYLDPNTSLTQGSVRDVVSAGRHIDDESLLDALHAAGCDFLTLDANCLNKQISNEIVRLSGGQEQRLKLARSIAGKPQYFLLRDPLIGLDQASARRVADRITHYTRGGVVVIWTTNESPWKQHFDVVNEETFVSLWKG